MSSESSQAYRQRMIAKGCCPNCGKEKEKKELFLCWDCRVKHSHRQIARRKIIKENREYW